MATRVSTLLTVMLMGHIGPVCARGRVGGGYIGGGSGSPSSRRRGAVVCGGDCGGVCGVLTAAESVLDLVCDAAHGEL